jgi:hypothetical protein
VQTEFYAPHSSKNPPITLQNLALSVAKSDSIHRPILKIKIKKKLKKRAGRIGVMTTRSN